MPRDSHRDDLIDAAVALLLESGESGFTLDAVARRAGMSKGGLLHHFSGKAALVDALGEHLDRLAADDIRDLESDPQRTIERFLRGSIETDKELDRVMVALARLGGDSATAALRRAEQGWHDLVTRVVPDPVQAEIILLVSDGLYFGALRGAGFARVDAPMLDALVERLA
ncbi:TetR/AcrR family transcriptional regulator [Schumannella luteola]|uniref:AcrR family transcriptional regulator n=1 Tax=Schumannella luteola TaxID=472059 RepID=A0A852Y9Y1_9MICO|nr:AcrR family transcriptional regulator [Schumannella luteola]TPX05636.1 TetR/AcrR family transcriptional regulator [Schumannella luteola]